MLIFLLKKICEKDCFKVWMMQVDENQKFFDNKVAIAHNGVASVPFKIKACKIGEPLRHTSLDVV